MTDGFFIVSDAKIIQVLKGICGKAHATLLAVLRTENAGETVDNMMGVDFDLPPYAMIYKPGKNTKYDSISKVFYDCQREIRDKENLDFQCQRFDIESNDSFQGVIDNLRETDNYQVIYRDTTYEDPEPVKGIIKRLGATVTLSVQRTYSLLVPFDEIARYCHERSRDSHYQYDFFHDVLRDNEEYLKMVSNKYFPGDSTKIVNTCLTAEGVVFVFQTKTDHEIMGGSRLQLLNEATNLEAVSVLEDPETIVRMRDLITNAFTKECEKHARAT